jgi:hypothetical protein
MSKQTIPFGYTYEFNRDGTKWDHEWLIRDGVLKRNQDKNVVYCDILEMCLRKEFDDKLARIEKGFEEKLKTQQEEIDVLKQALVDTLATIAAK